MCIAQALIFTSTSEMTDACFLCEALLELLVRPESSVQAQHCCGLPSTHASFLFCALLYCLASCTEFDLKEKCAISCEVVIIMGEIG